MLLIGSIGAVGSLAAAPVDLPSFSTEAAPSYVGGGRARIVVSGTWPDTCVPRPFGSKLVGRHIEVSISVDTDHCLMQPTHYAFTVNETSDRLPFLSADTVYTVGLVLKAGDAERRVGFGVIEFGVRSRPALESGIWWSDRSDGQQSGPGLGFAIEAQGDRLALATLGFDLGGATRWLIGTGPRTGRIAKLELVELRGGRGPLGSWRAPDETLPAAVAYVVAEGVGRARLYLIDAVPAGAGDQIVEVRVSSHGIERFSLREPASSALIGDWIVIAKAEGADKVVASARFTIEGKQPSAAKGGLRSPAEAALVEGLKSAAGDSLNCMTNEAFPAGFPTQCVWSGPDGEARFRFMSIATNRMSGRTPAGIQVDAFRR